MGRRTLLRSGLAAAAVATAPGWTRRRGRGPADGQTARAAWAGDALQESVHLSALTAGTTSVAAAVSASPDMSDPLVTTLGAPPDVSGWNRWVVEGLTAGTAYYWQLVDTPDGGSAEPFGPVSTFRTLQAAGEACTVRRAVGSCVRTRGADSTAAVDDILAWGPDRLMHLGDLGYPPMLTRSARKHVHRSATSCSYRAWRRCFPPCASTTSTATTTRTAATTCRTSRIR